MYRQKVIQQDTIQFTIGRSWNHNE